LPEQYRRTLFQPPLISNPAIIAGNGTIEDKTARGFFIEYAHATNAGTTITATLSNASGKFNWCAYGSDFPPNAVDNGSGGYTLRGTPPFVINGTIEWNATTYSGSVMTALTDATGCPGALCGKNGEAPGLLNCCANGTTNCNGTCTTNGNYTTKDGACTGSCNQAYEQLRNQCGDILNPQYATYQTTKCANGCQASLSNCCRPTEGWWVGDYPGACKDECTRYGLPYYNESGDGFCCCCN
jgi:hypothetical protein